MDSPGNERKRRARKDVAAERLSTPDQLDQVIQVARFPSWLALGALILVAAAGIVVSVYVPVPVKVGGEGILINLGGILTVTSDTEGRLTELLVVPRMVVVPGQTVAKVDQPRLRRALDDRRAELEEARRRQEQIRTFHQQTSATQAEAIANQTRALAERREAAVRFLASLESQLQADIDLNRDGIIPERQVTESRTKIDDARTDLAAIDNEIRQFDKVRSDGELAQQRELLDVRLEVSDLARQVASLEEEYARDREIESPYTGRVVELKVNPGEIVERNDPLFSLLPVGEGDRSQNAASELIAVLYVPPAEGKKIKRGMAVQLALSSIKREEFGFMLGRVEAVAEVPSTTEGMMRVLQNRQLVQQLSHSYAPFEVLVKLERDPSTRSRYRWSSSAGPDVEINVGTLCSGDVITTHERPIDLAFPFLKRLVGG